MSLSTTAFAFSTPSPWPTFKTEPTMKPQFFDITHMTENKSLLASGYFFLDPYYRKNLDGVGPWGPQIYTTEGELVWHGPKGMRTQDFHVCDYLGTQGKHLCVHERLQRRYRPPEAIKFGLTSGRKFVMDQTYTQVSRNFTQGISGYGSNGHEFREVENGRSFLHPVFVPTNVDLSPYKGPKNGWVADGCVQEVDFKTGKPIFNWCWLDHLPIWQTNLWPTFTRPTKNATHPVAGKGTRGSLWDYIHLNSADKTSEGDYLISARHCDQIVKIAGKNNVHGVRPGTVLWQLGGQGNQFKKKFSFYKQHAIRVYSTTKTETIISLFNNDYMAGPNFADKTTASEGQIILVNNKTMKASLIQRFAQPNGVLANSRGNLQILENDNVVVGWGALPALTEYDKNGDVLLHARYSGGYIRDPGAEDLHRYETSYRAFKTPWIGKPKTSPKIIAYTKSCWNVQTALVMYVSWNGATEVEFWRFHTATRRSGPWFLDGNYPKDGFETMVHLSNTFFAKYVRVEGIDTNGEILGEASTKIYMPKKKVSHKCNEQGCKPAGFHYNQNESAIDTCSQHRVYISLPLIVFIICVEALSYLRDLGWYTTPDLGYDRLNKEEDDSSATVEKRTVV